LAVDISLRTNRLILRSWRESDLEPFAALNADPRVMGYFRSVLSRDESDAMAAKLSKDIEDRGFGLYAVEVPDRAPFIGLVGVSVPSFPTPFAPCVEVGWRLAHEYWGHGYAAEAAAAAVNDAFSRLDLDEILSFTVPQNHRSRTGDGKTRHDSFVSRRLRLSGRSGRPPASSPNGLLAVEVNLEAATNGGLIALFRKHGRMAVFCR
jgi:RimJ/RimL family protein N-acetyltransferase